jgi:adenine-specific DNA-methyltransferase
MTRARTLPITGANREAPGTLPLDLFGDFNGLPADAQTEVYQHDAHWSNRMILGERASPRNL